MGRFRNLDAISSYANLFITIISALILIPIIESNVGKNYYGIYQFILTLAIYSEMISLGLGKTVERYVAKYSAEHNKDLESAAVSITLFIYMITAAVFFAGAGVLTWQFGNIFNFRGSELDVARLSFVIAAFNAGLNVIASLFWCHLRGRARFSFVYNLFTANALLRVPLFILLLRAGHGIVTLFLVDLILAQSINLVYASVSIITYRLNIKLFYFDKALFKKFFQFTVFIFLGGIGNLLYWNADNIILAIFTNAEIIAEYALSQRLLDYFFRYSIAFSGLFLPQFMANYMAKGQHLQNSALADLFTRSSRVMGILMSFAIVNFLVLGRDFIVLWIGPHYPMTYVYAAIILVPYWLVLSQSTGTEMMYVMKRHKVIALIYLGTALVNIAATVYLVQRIGPIGAAISTGATLLVGVFLLGNLYFRHLLQLNLLDHFKAVFLKNALVSVVVLMYGFGLNQVITRVSVVNFIGKGMLLNLIFIPLIYLVFLTRDERRAIRIRISAYREQLKTLITKRPGSGEIMPGSKEQER